MRVEPWCCVVARSPGSLRAPCGSASGSSPSGALNTDRSAEAIDPLARSGQVCAADPRVGVDADCGDVGRRGGARDERGRGAGTGRSGTRRKRTRRPLATKPKPTGHAPRRRRPRSVSAGCRSAGSERESLARRAERGRSGLGEAWSVPRRSRSGSPRLARTPNRPRRRPSVPRRPPSDWNPSRSAPPRRIVRPARATAATPR